MLTGELLEVDLLEARVVQVDGARHTGPRLLEHEVAFGGVVRADLVVAAAVALSGRERALRFIGGGGRGWSLAGRRLRALAVRLAHPDWDALAVAAHDHRVDAEERERRRARLHRRTPCSHRRHTIRDQHTHEYEYYYATRLECCAHTVRAHCTLTVHVLEMASLLALVLVPFRSDKRIRRTLLFSTTLKSSCYLVMLANQAIDLRLVACNSALNFQEKWERTLYTRNMCEKNNPLKIR